LYGNQKTVRHGVYLLVGGEMLLRAIALDYDGTIAVNGVLNQDVREAITKARQTGLLVIIVTGRILRELRCAAGELDFVDGVVAENGAVLLLSNGHRRLLAPPPFPILLNKLRDRNIEFTVGRCLIDLDAEHAANVLSIIRELELPLAISFNRNRMMVLPQATSKASGLKEMLNILGTSIHNAIGIGDAENDYDLLRCCEYGIAVEWAPYLLKEEADFVLAGQGPEAVAKYISQISYANRLPPGLRKHRKLVLESIAGQASLEISIRGRNILVAGDTKSGKSWLAGLFCEQMILQHYTMLVFDPEGDYGSLTSLPNTVVLGGGKYLPEQDDLINLLHQGLNLVLDLSHLEHAEKYTYIRQHLPLAASYRRSRGYPHCILLDECHYFLEHSYSEGILDSEIGSYLLVTYLPSKLPPDVRQSFEVVVCTRIVDRKEVDTLKEIAGLDPEKTDWFSLLKNLETTEAAMLPPTEEAGSEVHRFTVAPRLTLHVRHRTKYFERPVAPSQAFVFTDNGVHIGVRSLTLAELLAGIRTLPEHAVIEHVKRHDFSQWISNALGEHDFAASVQELEAIHHDTFSVDTFVEKLIREINRRYEHDISLDTRTFQAG